MAKCMLNPSYPSRPPLDRHHLAILHRERQPAVLERERLVAKKLAPPAVQGRHIGIVVVGDLLELVDGGDHLGGDRVALRRHAQQHLGSSTVAVPLPPPRWRSMRGRLFGSRASPRATACRMSWPHFERSNPRGSERKAASRSTVVGACIAISPSTSSLSTRPRGTSRVCASRSRQAATSISTASSFGLRTRVLSRSQAVSGSAR